MHYSVRLAQMLQTCIASIFKNACRKTGYELYSQYPEKPHSFLSPLTLKVSCRVNTAVLCLAAHSCPTLCNPTDCM